MLEILRVDQVVVVVAVEVVVQAVYLGIAFARELLRIRLTICFFTRVAMAEGLPAIKDQDVQ